MMANPPGTTGTRSSRRPGSCSLRTSPASSNFSRSQESPAAVMPEAAMPFFCRISASERAVPEEPTASLHPAFS